MYGIVAKKAGFCFGVVRSLELVKKKKVEGNSLQILGELIHNRTVLRELKESDIETIEDMSEFREGAIFVIRSHGITKELEEKIRAKGIRVLDTTCPLVKRIHKIIQKSNFERIVLVGDNKHPEVAASLSYAKNIVSVNSVEDAEKLSFVSNQLIIAQTTLNTVFFEEISKILKKKAEENIIQNTICSATRERQEAIKELALEVDFIVILGGKNSSNTKKLFEIAKKYNSASFWIHEYSQVKDIDLSDVEIKKGVFAVSGGASTPPDEIEKVKIYFESLIKEQERKYG